MGDAAGTGLDAVLGRRVAPGVHRSYAAPAEVGERAAYDGWVTAQLDGAAYEDREGLLAGLGRALGFPEWYGENLDALADCLREVTGTVLVWDGWSRLYEADPRSFGLVLRVLAQRAEDGPAFAVVLTGAPGPSGEPEPVSP